MGEWNVVDVESTDGLRRRVRWFILGINYEPQSHLFSCSSFVRYSQVSRERHLFRSFTFIFTGAFTFGTVIFFFSVRMSSGHTTIMVNKTVAFRSFGVIVKLLRVNMCLPFSLHLNHAALALAYDCEKTEAQTESQRSQHSDTDTPTSVAALSHWIMGKAPPTSPDSGTGCLLYTANCWEITAALLLPPTATVFIFNFWRNDEVRNNIRMQCNSVCVWKSDMMWNLQMWRN